jgi:hypothetical protein
MMRLSLVASVALAVALLAGCRDHDHGAHAPPAPHGGDWLETGGGQVRVEMVHQPRDARIIVYFMDANLTPLPALAEPPTLTLIAADQRHDLPMQPVEGSPGAYQVTHDAFKGEDFRGLLNYTVGGVPHTAELGGEHHGHAH